MPRDGSEGWSRTAPPPVQILLGDCRDRLAELPESSVDSIVCDPPYELGFMGKSWDASGIAYSLDVWKAALRALKPGGHLLAFSGTRTYHRMVVAIEDVGFEIRDQLAWVYGSGFPKSLDVSKAIDKGAGAEREKKRFDASQVGNFKARQDSRPWIEAAKEQGFHEVAGDEPVTAAAAAWQGWGTALKPSWEPICLARKPLVGTVANNVLAHGTGALNIDGCRIEAQGRPAREVAPFRDGVTYGGNALEGRVDGSLQSSKAVGTTDVGRWPANLVHDGSDEVVEHFPAKAGVAAPVHRRNGDKFRNTYGAFGGNVDEEGSTFRGDSGSAARFFYCAKTSKSERGEGNDHPTVKPQALMRWLCRLVTPPDGLVLDPFLGSGSTGLAAMSEGFRFIGIELNPEYVAIAERRLGLDLA